MPVFPKINMPNTGDSKKDFDMFKIELERRLGHFLSHINQESLILGLAADRLVQTDPAGNLDTVSLLSNWIIETVNQITVTDNGDGTATLSLPQNIDTDADVEFDSIILDDLTASRLTYSDGSKKVQSVANLTNWIAGTAGNITVTDDGDGTVTLKSIGSSKNVKLVTTTPVTLLVSEQGFVECSSASAITLNLPTAVGNTGLSYSITNINTGTVTIDPNGSETIQGDSTFDLYEDENLQITSNGTNWSVG
jgi:hypothetical protein